MKIQDSRNTQGIKITGTSFFPKKKRLRQCITHTQGIQIPGTSFFLKKKGLRQCITHTQGTQIPRNVIFSEKKAPAAVHHTHTGHKNTRNVIFAGKNAPAARQKNSPSYHSQMDTDIFVIGHTHIQFELIGHAIAESQYIQVSGYIP